MSGIDQDDVVAFLDLSEQIGTMNEQLNQLKAARGKIEERLVEQFMVNNVQSMNVNGSTVYRHTEQFANCKADCRQQLVAWARENGLDEMIVVQPARFKSWCREQLNDQENGELPPAVAEMVEIFEKQSMRVRKS